jgi:tetratricopeptide (TPR) repeat protein
MIEIESLVGEEMRKILSAILVASILIGGAGCDPLRPGKKLMAEGKYEPAANFFIARTKSHPKDYRAFNELGFSYARLGMTGNAVAAYRQAIAIKPDYFSAYLNLGTLNMKNTDIDGAYYALLKAVALNPKSEVAQVNLAWTEVANFHLKEAEQQRQAAIRLSGGKNQYQDLAQAIAKRQVEKERYQESVKKAKEKAAAAPQAGGPAATTVPGGTTPKPTSPSPAPAAPVVPPATPASAPASIPKSPN